MGNFSVIKKRKGFLSHATTQMNPEVMMLANSVCDISHLPHEIPKVDRRIETERGLGVWGQKVVRGNSFYRQRKKTLGDLAHNILSTMYLNTLRKD